jgi:hypothetical protein
LKAGSIEDVQCLSVHQCGGYQDVRVDLPCHLSIRIWAALEREVSLLRLKATNDSIKEDKYKYYKIYIDKDNVAITERKKQYEKEYIAGFNKSVTLGEIKDRLDLTHRDLGHSFDFDELKTSSLYWFESVFVSTPDKVYDSVDTKFCGLFGQKECAGIEKDESFKKTVESLEAANKRNIQVRKALFALPSAKGLEQVGQEKDSTYNIYNTVIESAGPVPARDAIFNAVKTFSHQWVKGCKCAKELPNKDKLSIPDISKMCFKLDNFDSTLMDLINHCPSSEFIKNFP